MGKKRKLLDPCTHLRALSQDKNDECRICGHEPVKKVLAIRNRNRFDGQFLNSAAKSLVAPLTSSRVFKKASYTTARCHAVGISSARSKSSLSLGSLSHGHGAGKSHPEKVSGKVRAHVHAGCEKSELDQKNLEEDKNEYAVVNDSGSIDELTTTIDEGRRTPIRQLPLKPLFFEVPQEEEQRYIQRNWIFSIIDSFLVAKPYNRGVIVHGGAGTGKTTLALQLVEHSCFGRKSNFNVDAHGNLVEAGVESSIPENRRRFLRLVSHIVAYHFCQVENRTTCLVPEFVHSIAAQLCQAPMLSSYRQFLEHNSKYLELLSMENCMMNPASAFVNGILEPLIQLRKEKKLPMGYFILVLDSICEAESHRPYAGDTICSFLSKHCLKIPPWFKLIVTVRSNQLDITSLLPFKTISLDSMEENILHDLEEYINYRFEKISKLKHSIVANRNGKNEVSLLPNLKHHLKQLSGGCFLFLKLTLDLIEHGHLVIKSSSFKVLPVSLSEVYMLHCNLRFPTQNAFGNVLPILSTCIAALSPLNLLEIYHSVNSLQANENLPWVEFLRIFKNVQGLLVKRLDGTYMFFHSSFRDWLSGRDGGNCKFLCDIRMGHAAIAFRLIRVETPLNPSKTLDLTHHILKANVFKKSGYLFNTGDLPTKEMQALWLLSSTVCISEALASFTNIYCTNLKVSQLLLLAGASPDTKTNLLENAPLIVVCAAEGNIGLLSLLLEFQVDVNAANDSGDTALHVASERGHLQVVEYLQRHGAKVSKLNFQKECPIVTATSAAQLDVLSFFLSNEWDDNAEMSISKEEATLQSLVAACSLGLVPAVECLMSHCQMKNVTDRFNGETPLTAACKNGRTDVVDLLIKVGVNLNTPDQTGTPPLISAVKEGHHKILMNLLSCGANVNCTDENKRTGLIAAARLDDVLAAEILTNKDASLRIVDKDGMSPLGWACMRANVKVCRFLLRFPLEINQTDTLGRTPLHLAAFSGSEEITQLLLEKGAALEHADLKGIRPLDRAVGCNHVTLVQMFLRKGAKLAPTTWGMAIGKPRIILCLLNKLLEDGRFLFQNDQINDAEHRFQYALRKIPPQEYDEEMQSVFKNIQKLFLLELLNCKLRKNDLDDVIKYANEIIVLDPYCQEAYYEKVEALFTIQRHNEGLTSLSKALELPGLAPELQRKLVDLKQKYNK